MGKNFFGGQIFEQGRRVTPEARQGNS
jgi:hypothetical protein